MPEENINHPEADNHYRSLHRHLQIWSEGLRQANEALNRIKLKSLSKVHPNSSEKSLVIFDHTTEKEDERVAEIIEKIRKLKTNNQSEVEKSITEGKKKIDKAIKRKLNKKYLKF